MLKFLTTGWSTSIPELLSNEAKKRNMGLKIDDVSIAQY